MTEILTESFCERCGTRYTFEPVDRRRKPLSGIGTLGRGLKHFVSDPGASLDEALAVARSEHEQRTTAHALEAFHRTFNFCLSCRQYTCADCWNAVEGRCLTCAPRPDAVPAEADGATLAAGASGSFASPVVTTPDPAAVGAIAEAEVLAAEAEAARVAAEADAEALQTRLAEEARREAETAAATAAARAQEAETARIAAEQAARLAAEEEAARIAAEEMVRAEEAARLAAEAGAARLAAEEEAAGAAQRSRDDSVGAPLTFEPGRNLDEEIAAFERARAAASAEPVPTDTRASGGAAAEPHWPDAAATRAGAPEEPAAEAPSMPLAARACPSCGLSLSASARFCRRCGMAQQADAPH